MTKKILIVDDEPNIVISLEFLMKKEGFEVAVANDGDEALAMVGSFNPDLLLLDVMMPKKSGYEVCEAVRADPPRVARQKSPRDWHSAPMPMSPSRSRPRNWWRRSSRFWLPDRS